MTRSWPLDGPRIRVRPAGLDEERGPVERKAEIAGRIRVAHPSLDEPPPRRRAKVARNDHEGRLPALSESADDRRDVPWLQPFLHLDGHTTRLAVRRRDRDECFRDGSPGRTLRNEGRAAHEHPPLATARPADQGFLSNGPPLGERSGHRLEQVAENLRLGYRPVPLHAKQASL